MYEVKVTMVEVSLWKNLRNLIEFRTRERTMKIMINQRKGNVNDQTKTHLKRREKKGKGIYHRQ